MKAKYRCMIGDKVRNALISSAGLGITGAYSPVVYTVEWNDGEIVTRDRAQKLCHVLLDGLCQSGADCSSVELISLD